MQHVSVLLIDNDEPYERTGFVPDGTTPEQVLEALRARYADETGDEYWVADALRAAMPYHVSLRPVIEQAGRRWIEVLGVDFDLTSVSPSS